MSFKLIDLASALENSDELHEARLLILMLAVSGKGENSHPVDGIMKLAKMDFLLRYPAILARALNAVSKKRGKKIAEKITDERKDTIEGRMIRFRYGPWDKRYRRWLSVLAAKNLVEVKKEGRTVKIRLSEKGKEVAGILSKRNEFEEIAQHAEMVRFAVGDMAATKVKDFIYEIAPEIISMKWGRDLK